MSEKDFSEADFDEFAKKFSDYLAKANESKKRGNNDYNPLKAVQNPNDEVNMHSGFLVSLLDTRGEHYQDDLFLRLFLENLKLKDCGNDENLSQWFGETKNAQVFKEYKNIDIYISNGEKHIIIENKIWYDDRDGQIARYINEIHANSSDDESVSYENIAVVYLSPFGREPNPNSLCLKDKNIKWQIKGDLLEFNENKVKYKQISYEKDILAWIKECQKEVGNITSLNSALEFYKDIVKIITKQKDSKMNIAGFFKEQKDFEIAFEISSNMDKIANQYLIKHFFNNMQEMLDNKKWVVELGDNDSVCISDKEFYDNTDIFFYFCFYWYNNNKGKSRFWCAIMIDETDDKIKQLLKNKNCEFYEDDGSIALKWDYCDCENIKSLRELEIKIIDFVNKKADKIREFNRQIGEIYL